MVTTTLGVEGMACSMCEVHIADALRRNFPVKRAKCNRRKRTCVVTSDAPLDEDAVRSVIEGLGYSLVSFS